MAIVTCIGSNGQTFRQSTRLQTVAKSDLDSLVDRYSMTTPMGEADMVEIAKVQQIINDALDQISQLG